VDYLFRCVAASDLPRIRLLLEAGLSIPSLVDGPTTRNSVLHWAASFGTPDVVALLVSECDVDVNAVNAVGWTPLHDAVHRGDAAVVAALLAVGADADCVIPSGKLEGMSARDMGLSKVMPIYLK
jgi:isopentenyl phosphate kinase